LGGVEILQEGEEETTEKEFEALKVSVE